MLLETLKTNTRSRHSRLKRLNGLPSTRVIEWRVGALPRVEVWAEETPDEHVVHVRDNGVGIAPEARGKIFGIFERFHSGYEGTGVGLAVARRAMERMGGAVTFTSEPGCGSCFRLELPLAP